MNYDHDIEPPVDFKWNRLYMQASDKNPADLKEDLITWGLLDEDEEKKIDLVHTWVSFMYDAED